MKPVYFCTLCGYRPPPETVLTMIGSDHSNPEMAITLKHLVEEHDVHEPTFELSAIYPDGILQVGDIHLPILSRLETQLFDEVTSHASPATSIRVTDDLLAIEHVDGTTTGIDLVDWIDRFDALHPLELFLRDQATDFRLTVAHHVSSWLKRPTVFERVKQRWEVFGQALELFGPLDDELGDFLRQDLRVPRSELERLKEQLGR